MPSRLPAPFTFPTRPEASAPSPAGPDFMSEREMPGIRNADEGAEALIARAKAIRSAL